VKAVSADGTLS